MNNKFTFDVIIHPEKIFGAGNGENIHEHTEITKNTTWKGITNTSFTYAGFLNQYAIINGNADKQVLITSQPPKTFTIEKLMTDTLILETILRPQLIKPSGGLYPQSDEKWQPSFTVQIIANESYITYYGCTIRQYSLNINPETKYVVEIIEFQPHFAETKQGRPPIVYNDDPLVFVPVFDTVSEKDTGLKTVNIDITFTFKYNTNRLNPLGWVSYLEDTDVRFVMTHIPLNFAEAAEILAINTPQKYQKLTVKLENLSKKLVFEDYHKNVSENVRKDNYTEFEFDCRRVKNSKTYLENL